MKNFIVIALAIIALINNRIHAENDSYIVFDEAHTNGTAWTFHNIRFYNNKVNNAYLSSGDGYIESPLFTNPIVRVSISFKASSVNTRRLMTVVPMDGCGNDIAAEQREFAPPLEKDYAILEWDAGMGVCRFRIGATKGSNQGSIHLYDCLVELEGGIVLAFAPSGLETRRIRGNSFVAGWEGCSGAESYLVDLYKVERVPSSWDAETFQEDFSAAVNETGNTTEIHDISSIFPSFDGTKVYIPAHTNGLVQIGTGDKAGYIALRSCYIDAGSALRFRAKRYTHEDEGSVMPLLWACGGETNSFAAVELRDEMADYEVPLSGVPAGSAVVLHSTTNRSTTSSAHGRVWLDSVSVVSGYVPALVSTNAVAESVATVAVSRKFSGLEKGATYLWRVRSVVGGTVSAPSAFVEVVPEGQADNSGTAIIIR